LREGTCVYKSASMGPSIFIDGDSIV